MSSRLAPAVGALHARGHFATGAAIHLHEDAALLARNHLVVLGLDTFHPMSFVADETKDVGRQVELRIVAAALGVERNDGGKAFCLSLTDQRLQAKRRSGRNEARIPHDEILAFAFQIRGQLGLLLGRAISERLTDRGGIFFRFLRPRRVSNDTVALDRVGEDFAVAVEDVAARRLRFEHVLLLLTGAAHELLVRNDLEKDEPGFEADCPDENQSERNEQARLHVLTPGGLECGVRAVGRIQGAADGAAAEHRARHPLFQHGSALIDWPRRSRGSREATRERARSRACPFRWVRPGRARLSHDARAAAAEAAVPFEAMLPVVGLLAGQVVLQSSTR